MPVSAHRKILQDHLLADFERILPTFPLPELHGQRLFVTGGTGFIGYWLILACHWLNLHGTDIKLTLLSRDPERFLATHPECRELPWLEWIKGDVKNYPPPSGHFDAFIHGAADTSPAATHSAALFDDITLGTQHVIEHAAAIGTRRLLFISSGAVYGEQPGTLAALPEDFSGLSQPLAPDDTYGRGKRAMEAQVLSAAGKQPIEPVIARCFSFVGLGLPKHLAISQLIDDARHHRTLCITGDGRAVRSYLHAADLVVWLLALLCRGRCGQAYNVGSPTPLSILDVASITRDTLAPAVQIEVQNRLSEAPRQRYIPDIRRIEQELHVDCWTPLENAIRSMAKAQELNH